MDRRFQLHTLRDAKGNTYSALMVPKSLPDNFGCCSAPPEKDIYNLIMVDTSSSMRCYWPSVVDSWKSHIKNNLKGRTNIYTFGDYVDLKRCEPDLLQEDMLEDQTLNFTIAARHIRKRVQSCTESNVCIFIISNGTHDIGEPYPESEICQMKPPSGKTIRVYIMGIGEEFPVQCCIDIRSQMHNGNINVPTFFWAKKDHEIDVQLSAIGDELKSNFTQLNLNVNGRILPGMDQTDSIHLGEWVFFEQSPEELPALSLSVNGGVHITIKADIMPNNTGNVLCSIFRQWNSSLIQLRRKSETTALEALDVMESIHSYSRSNYLKNLSRNDQSKLKKCENEYRQCMNTMKSLLGNGDQLNDQRKLANAILRTTIAPSKYRNRIDKLKSHSPQMYKEERETFLQLYETVKPGILALSPATTDEMCRFTLNSTLCQLQDPDFCSQLQKNNKYELLKSFTMSGIPINFHMRNWSQINPWTLAIDDILSEPHSILSQVAIEEAYETLGCPKNGAIQLKLNDEKILCNAIIPTIPARAAIALKPLVQSKLYAMMTTFCILKNPNIIDHSVHLASLGCAWIKTIRDYPKDERPQFVTKRLDDITATAQLYIDRPLEQKYMDVLINQPSQAIMVTSGRYVMSQSLVKAAFFLNLTTKGNSLPSQRITEIFELLIFEFFNRCLSKYKKRVKVETPFTDFFDDSGEIQEWMRNKYKVASDSLRSSYGDLLQRFFTPEEVISNHRQEVSGILAAICKLQDDSIGINMEKVRRLKNLPCCGDVTWSTFERLAQEFNIASEDIERVLSPAMATRYVSAALQAKQRERTFHNLPSHDEALDTAKERIVEERKQIFKKEFFGRGSEFENSLKDQWKEAYRQVHNDLAMPLTQKQIIEQAQAKGIHITQETFDQIYKYDSSTKLLRNACQIRECPHYLQPHNNLGQHLSFSRNLSFNPHCFHKISREFCSQGIDTILQEILSRNNGSGLSDQYMKYLRKHIETLITVYTQEDN